MKKGLADITKKRIADFFRRLAGWPSADGDCGACSSTPDEPREGDACSSSGEPGNGGACSSSPAEAVEGGPSGPTLAEPVRGGGGGCCGGYVPSPGEAGMQKATPTDDSSYVLRPATPADLQAVRRLIAGCSLPTEGLKQQFGDRYAVAVADSSCEIVGVAGYEVHGSQGLLRSVAVAPAWRGLGVGAELTRDRIAAAGARNLDELYTLTTTAADYFRSFGFRSVERGDVPRDVRASKEFDEICPSTATVLRLDLRKGTEARSLRSKPS